MIEPSLLRGTGVALATPIQNDQSIDFEGLERLIDHVIAGGVNYLVSMGTTGEAPTFSWDEKMKVLDHTISYNKGRLPVVFGLGSYNTNDVLSTLDLLPDSGIDALLSVSPYYNRPSQEGIKNHYQLIADKSNYPIILYNVPARTGSNIETATTLSLSEHSNVIGVKEATTDLKQFGAIAARKPDDFLLISGEDSLAFPSMSLGADGLISVLANCLPVAVSEMIAKSSEAIESARQQYFQLQHFFELSVREGNPTSIKTGLQALEICGREVRPPLARGSSALLQAFTEALTQTKKG